jgi:primary-amine oxidase
LVTGRELPSTTRFVFIELAEPPKDLVTSWRPGIPWDRQAAALLRDHTAKATYEAIVSLTRTEIVSWRLVDGAQPPMMFEEFTRARSSCAETSSGNRRCGGAASRTSRSP